MHRQEGGAAPSKLRLPVSFLDAPPHPKVAADTAVPCYCSPSSTDHTTLIHVLPALTRAFLPLCFVHRDAARTPPETAAVAVEVQRLAVDISRRPSK